MTAEHPPEPNLDHPNGVRPGSDVSAPTRLDVIALVVGSVVGIVVALDVILIWFFLSNSTVSTPMGNLVLFGVPFAILVLIVCGAMTRRFRLYLVGVGCLLFAAPVIGFAISSLLRS